VLAAKKNWALQGNSEHFYLGGKIMENIFRNSAWLYDLDIQDTLTEDIPFYIGYAQKQKGEILELGCGTGRVTFPLARQGFKVTGLDLSEQMLEVFRHKLNMQPALIDKISIKLGNMANFSFDRKFSLIIAPFRAFQALTSDGDIAMSLKCIKEHLADDGISIINVFNPRAVMDESWCYPETVQWERFDENTGNYVVKTHWGDKIDPKNQIIYPHFAYEVTDKNGITTRITDDLKLKYYYRDQLESVIEKAGLIIGESFGWYDRTPLNENSREIILVCGR